jgi:hypothetical protein
LRKNNGDAPGNVTVLFIVLTKKVYELFLPKYSQNFIYLNNKRSKLWNMSLGFSVSGHEGLLYPVHVGLSISGANRTLLELIFI